LDEPKGALGWPMAWLNPRSTGMADGLVESKEHWGGDYTKRWCREVDNFKWTTLREVWPMNKDGRF
jgi:hypothetical protein